MGDLVHHKEAFLTYLSVLRGASPHTIRNYASDLDFFFSSSDAAPTKETVRRFIFSQRSSGLSKKSVSRRLATLRAFFKYCLRERLIALDPMEHIDNPKLERTLPCCLSYQQVTTLCEAPDTTTYTGVRDRAMLELLYSSGLRVSELVGLQRSDCDFAELLLHIRGKGKKERIVPATENAMRWLHSYLSHTQRHVQQTRRAAEQDHDAVFLNRFGTRMSPRSVDRLFASYVSLCGLDPAITPHSMRHTIATHWLERGMDIKTIQLILGHSTMETTTIYTKVSTALKKKTIQSYT